jgi:hemoglobin
LTFTPRQGVHCAAAAIRPTGNQGKISMSTPSSVRRTGILTAFALSFAATMSVAQTSGTHTLYQRLGGYDFIAKFVDTAFPRVATQPQLHRLFVGHSIDSQMKQRQLIVDALCQATGGPCIYIGRPMGPLHDGLHITDSDWTEFMKIIDGTLVELKVPAVEQHDWNALFEQKFRPDVVEHTAK